MNVYSNDVSSERGTLIPYAITSITVATEAKSMIEQNQRDQLKDRKLSAVRWKNRIFWLFST